jgi:hypothetical protein
MRTIHIPVPLALVVMFGASAAAVAAQMPEIRRYMKVRAMD